MNDRGRQMSRTGARMRNPSLKAIQSAESEEKMEKMKNGSKENKKSKKGKIETKKNIEYKEENSEDEWESQPLNLDLNEDSILIDAGGEPEDDNEGDKGEGNKKDGKCSVCRFNKANLDCDSCDKEYCFTCEEIDEKKQNANWHYYQYLIEAYKKRLCIKCKSKEEKEKEKDKEREKESIRKEEQEKLINYMKNTTEVIGNLKKDLAEAGVENKKQREKVIEAEGKLGKYKDELNQAEIKLSESTSKIEYLNDKVKNITEDRNSYENLYREQVKRGDKLARQISNMKRREETEIGEEDKRKEEIEKEKERAKEVKKIEAMEKEKEKEKKEEITEKNKEEKEQEKEKHGQVESDYCKDFMRGSCRFENRCWRKHISRKEYLKTIECKYHNLGNCDRGSLCDFKHMKKIECKYNNTGICNRGLSCEFKHMKKQICFRYRYYKDNYCWKGDSCEFEHRIESDIEINPSEMRKEAEEKQEEKTIESKKKNIAQKEGEKKEEKEKEKIFLEGISMEKRMERMEKLIEMLLKNQGIMAKGLD